MFDYSFGVECSELGMAGCGCFTKEDLVEVGNGFLMQRSKLEREQLCFKCKEYLTDKRLAELKGDTEMTNQEAIEYIKSIKGLFHTEIKEYVIPSSSRVLIHFYD